MSKVYGGGRRGSWMRSVGRCVGKFGWQDMSGGTGVIKELLEADVKSMLLSLFL